MPSRVYVGNLLNAPTNDEVGLDTTLGISTSNVHIAPNGEAREALRPARSGHPGTEFRKARIELGSDGSPPAGILR